MKRGRESVYCAPMEDTTALLERHRDRLDSPATLVVEATDAALARVLPRAHRHSEQWDPQGHFDVRALPVLPDGVERVLVILPKANERLDLLLATLAGQSRGALELWLVGRTRGGIRGGSTRLQQWAGPTEKLDSARHCKLVRAWLPPGPPVSLADFARRTHVAGLELVSYPGVFSHGRLDEGTAELLPLVEAASGGGSVLDLGCGAGMLTAALARAGHAVTAVDVSSTAVAATRATLVANGLEANVRRGNLYDGLGRFDGLWSNPPFHEGTRRTLAVTERLVGEAPEHLVSGGSLTLVANRELPYPDLLDTAFGRHQVLRETSRFRVYRAVRT